MNTVHPQTYFDPYLSPNSRFSHHSLTHMLAHQSLTNLLERTHSPFSCHVMPSLPFHSISSHLTSHNPHIPHVLHALHIPQLTRKKPPGLDIGHPPTPKHTLAFIRTTAPADNLPLHRATRAHQRPRQPARRVHRHRVRPMHVAPAGSGGAPRVLAVARRQPHPQRHVPTAHPRRVRRPRRV